MSYWRIVILLAPYLLFIGSITINNKQLYSLGTNQTHQQTKKVQNPLRITLFQYEGKISLIIIGENGQKIIESDQSIYENVISSSFIGKNVKIVARNNEKFTANGVIQIQQVQTYQILKYGQQKVVHLKKGETRIIEVHPKKRMQLTIERFDGIPQFINNRCKTFERKECSDEFHRFTPSEMKKHIQVVELEYCSNCILLTQITTKSQQSKIRLSIQVVRTIIQPYQTLLLLKKDKISTFRTYSDRNTKGKIVMYGGSVQITSDHANFTSFANGYFFTINDENSTQGNVSMLSFKGIDQLSYLMIQSANTEGIIKLTQGIPDTYYIQPNKTYTLYYENHNKGKANIIISSTSFLLSNLTIKFVDERNNEHYLIKPKYIFNETIVSQNFQIDQSEETVKIQIHLASNEGGYFNFSSEVKQNIVLPLDYPYSSILAYNESDEYIIEGLSGEVTVQIIKCTECSIKYAISEKPISKEQIHPLMDLSYTYRHKMIDNQLFIMVKTENYAYYSIVVTKDHKKDLSQPQLQSGQIKFYLQQDSQDNLLMEFQQPKCNHNNCLNVKYYLLEGSDIHHLSSKVYCHSFLFNFDERTKDIAVERIQPIKSGDLMSYARPLKNRDFIGLVAEIQGKLLSYKVINTQQVKLYHSMKWPFFYLSIFIFSAIFCSFLLFMSLRRKNHEQGGGYIRVSTTVSSQNL